jgi:hypothetical protein
MFVPAGATIVGFEAQPLNDGDAGPSPDVILDVAGRDDTGGRATVLGVVPRGGLQVHLHPRPVVPATAPAAPTGDGSAINVWEDDPGSRVLMRRPIPDPHQDPSVEFNVPAPAPGLYQPTTAEFRYWVAADAVARGIRFWHGIIGEWQWHLDGQARVLPVLLDDATPELNAFYDRRALNFFHGATSLGAVFSGESPDIVCHELGHAILDAIKPALWSAASHEAAALHESFGDISALLCAWQVDDLRDSVLRESGGRLYASSRLSRLAEQLGAAIRLSHPQDVEPDCLRNAVNSFTYFDPTLLPYMAPASQLSSEPHSFSRVFTGAFFEALASVVTATAGPGQIPDKAQALTAAGTLASVLIEAIRAAPIVSNLFAQVAGGMIRVAERREGGLAAILRGVFVRRSILSPRSASEVASLRVSGHAGVAGDAGPSPDTELDLIAVDATPYGLDRPLGLRGPSHHRHFTATSGDTRARSLDPMSALTAATSFADDIFRRGRVDVAAVARKAPIMRLGVGFTTHRLIAEDGSLTLIRRCFDCGLHRG